MSNINLKPEQLDYCNAHFNWFRNDITKCQIADESVERTSHPTILGHKQIANNLFNFIKEKDII